MHEPVARPKRLDEDHIGFLLVELGLLINAACFFLVARAIRAVDDNLAEL